MSGYPMRLADLGGAATEATAVEQVMHLAEAAAAQSQAADSLASIDGGIADIGSRPNGVLTRALPEAGNTVFIGEVGLQPLYGWHDRSPFLRSYNEVITIETEVFFTGTYGSAGAEADPFVIPDFKFMICEADSGQEGDTYPVDGTEWFFAERVNADIAGTISIPQDIRLRWRRRVSVQPLAAIRISVRAIPKGGILNVAGAKFWGAGIELL